MSEQTEDAQKPQCDDVIENMYLFLDKEITEEKRADVQQHLTECIPCLEAFEFEAELKTVIATRCKDKVPAHLYEKIMTSLTAETEGNSGQGGIPAS